MISAVKMAISLPMMILVLFSFSYAGEVILIDSDRQFRFAATCFKKSDYLLAIAEYKRFIHFFPGDKRVREAKYNIAMSWFFSDKMDKAIEAFNEIMDNYEIDDFTIKSYFKKSRCHERLKEYGEATVALLGLSMIADSVETRDEAYYRTGWLWLQSPSWEKSKKYFSKISGENREKYRIPSLAERLEAGPAKRKGPLAAGLLAIIPGLGHLYCERYHDAAVSFFLNVALAYSAWELFKNGNNALGCLVTLLETGFYSGNISSAITGARKYNRRQKEDFIDHLRRNLKVKLSAQKNMEGVMLSLKYRF